ncbi:MFS transporter [Alishewanella longhuensis]
MRSNPEQQASKKSSGFLSNLLINVVIPAVILS